MRTEPAVLPERQGLTAFQRFDATMGALLAVPASTLARRERAYRRKVEANPNRRGPKRKVKPSASPDPAA
jgi:hypothetical protein